MSIGQVRIATAPIAVLVAALVVVSGCDDAGDDAGEGEVVRAEVQSTPDGTLETHEIVPSTPTAEGLAYMQAVAAIHRDADAQSGEAQVATLQRGLALAVPAGLPEAEVLRLELASRIAAVWLESARADPTGPARAKDLLAPMLEPSRSVPLDRASAEALVLLGDAATRTGDDALAAGTYARSIRMMSILRQELER